MAVNRRVSEFSPGRNDNTHLYTKGGEYSLDGKEYVGEYHLVGVVPKSGPIANSQSRVLQRLYVNPDHYIYDRLNNFDVDVLNFVEPRPHLYLPQEQDYIVGYDNRYFVEKIEDDMSYAIEINQDQYNLINVKGGIDGGLYPSAVIRWKLTGKRADIITHNEMELYKASLKIPSINYAVRNFLEFARITLV